MIFSVACCIHAWPLIQAGKSDLYLYLHGANVGVVVITLLLAALPLSLLVVQMAAFAAFFVLPVVYLLAESKNVVVLRLFVNDMALFSIAAGIFSHGLYRLRREVAELNDQIRSRVTPFLGAHVTGALYDNRPEMLSTQRKTGFVLMMDLRGYADLMKNETPEVSMAMMAEYHQVVARVVGALGGVIHKSAGDGHLISFGLMASPDLSDLDELGADLEVAEARQKAAYFKLACQVFDDVARDFLALRIRYGIKSPLSLGAAMDYGEVEISLIGDARYRQEFDVNGTVVIRCARLEAYTKVLLNVVEGEKMGGGSANGAMRRSILIVGPTLVGEVKSAQSRFATWMTNRPGYCVRDFPDVDRIYFTTARYPSATVAPVQLAG